MGENSLTNLHAAGSSSPHNDLSSINVVPTHGTGAGNNMINSYKNNSTNIISKRATIGYQP
jgi:hypothetical protein